MMHSSPTQTPPSLRRDPAASNATAAQLPELVLAYYGDDFSGSADVMEALSLSGINAVLFLEPPTGDVLSRFPGVRAVGVAGVSRSMGVAQMRRDLPPLFAELGKLNAPLIHYKICSTFDSSPHVGSIGLAMDLGREAFQTSLVPIVVGAPALGRFCAFGNLFARSGLDSPIYRLDRHPTMAHHPTTPMQESDLRLVLARETDSRIGLIDIETIGRGRDAVGTALARLSAEGFQAVLFDTTQKSHLQIIGDALWALATEAQTGGPATNCRSAFVVGSSGVEYALCEHWQWSAAISARRHEAYQASRENIVCVSGSCSPVTARQIQYALEHGFVEVPLDPVRLAARSSTYLDVIADETLAALHRGDSVIIHSSRGPDDPRIGAFWRSRETVADSPSAAAIIGSQYGQLLRVVREHSGVRRIAVTGGDTSGYVGRKLGIEALSFVMPVAPGSPLCRIHARPHDALFDGVEIAFKGGQVGFADYLVRVRDGGASGRTAQIRHHAGRETND